MENIKQQVLGKSIGTKFTTPYMYIFMQKSWNIIFTIQKPSNGYKGRWKVLENLFPVSLLLLPKFYCHVIAIDLSASQEKTAFLNISINLLNGSVATD